MNPLPSTPLPKDLEPFRKAGEMLVQNGAVKQLEFSRRTYQILVEDPEARESFWAFIHLNPSGEVAECFCQCSDELEGDRCAHLAAGLMRIYHGTSKPLHVRYRESFFQALGFQLFKMGKPPKFVPENEEGKRFLEETFAQEAIPEEESSLKFSDLSEKELRSIRDDTLSDQLKFELSPLSDCFKKLFWFEESGELVTVDFKERASKLPLDIHVRCPIFSFSVKLTEQALEDLIPFLKNKRGGFKDLIQEVFFDSKNGELVLEQTDFKDQKILGVSIGKWIYRTEEGFFLKEHDPLLDLDRVPRDKIELFLDRYQDELSSLVNKGIYEKQGMVSFDEKDRLHFFHYLFEPGDLKQSGAYTFHNWVYLPERGFFKTLIPQDLPKEEIVKAPSVYEWVLSHQAFLAGIKGYKVHLKELEPFIEWQMDDTGALVFKSTLKGDFKAEPKEFGALIYVEGEGFFTKASFKDAISVQGGLRVPAVLVPSYIREREEDLKLVHGFFMKQSPVDKGMVDITLDGGQIRVHPTLELIDEFKEKKTRLYDEYLWVEGEGFYHLPEKHFLPLDFREEKIISEKHFKEFFDKGLSRLMPFIQTMDAALKAPQELVMSYNKELFFSSELGQVSFSEIQKAYKEKRNFLFSDAGRIDLKKKRFLRLFDLFKESGYPKLSLMEVYKLKAYEDIDLNPDDFKKNLPLNIDGLKSYLRPYQETGLKWLWFLYSNKLSGLLCDDMGLGKTHQAMALMAGIKNLDRQKRFLVVCPTSVLYHWEEKLAAFFPDVSVRFYHGLDRSLEHFKEDVLLTSYGVLRRDIDKIKAYDFEVSIYDEIQTAKNHQSKLWMTLKEIKAPMTLGLTGTPIENNLRELKSLFDITLPALMPPEKEFKESFLIPIEREENSKVKALLHRMIDPFLLRRTKGDVLQDLPEKTEEVAHTFLADEQKALYDKLYLQAKQLILPDLMDEMKQIPYIHIFTLISGLKKICDHPALYLQKTEDYKHYESGKWELFKELLEEAIGSEQKVVVFSHYLGMLDIIESYLTEAEIGFSGIRGSTTNRREKIARFQNDPDCKVFVASLKAGGLGIDLTEASVVIHYDRWWNAARENQATDRVHRIGQKRGVQVFKLVTKDTIEDRIHYLIEKKARRMEEIVGRDTADAVKGLTREELLEIFQRD